MPLATTLTGRLQPIQECYIDIPGAKKIILDNLPDIGDTKSATYADETVIGRASPIKTYSLSDNRSITMQIHFIISKPSDVTTNLEYLRAIQSAAYPRSGADGEPFIPPPVCKIRCGQLLKKDGDLCVVLKNYSVKFPTDVSWISDNQLGNDAAVGASGPSLPSDKPFTPMKFSVDTTWDVVYSSSALPGQNKIFTLGG